MPVIRRGTRRSGGGNAEEVDSDTSPASRPPRRAAAVNSAASTAAMQRNTSESPEPGRKVRITVKGQPSRLREVTNESELAAKRSVPSRSSKTRRPMVDHDSDEDEMDDEEDDLALDDDDDEDAEGEPEEEEDAEGEEDDDVDTTQVSSYGTQAASRSWGASYNGSRSAKQAAPVASKPTPEQALGATKSVEQKEMQDADMSSDEPLSELDDEDEEDPIGDGQDDDDDEEEEDEEDEEDADGDIDMDQGDTIHAASLDDDDLDSDDDSVGSGTPDPSKLTRRQRGAPESGLMALSNEAQKKKFFTDEQITMRRAEMARRRKDLSEKRNEEEKADTLNRLLHKQPPKRRNKAQMMADAEREEFGGTPVAEGEVIRPSRAFVRCVQSVKGGRIGIPDELVGSEASIYFDGAKKFDDRLKPVGPRYVMVQEVE